MSEDRSPEKLLERLRQGDSRAAEEIYNRFANRLIALAGTRLDERMRRKVDPDDVVMSAFRSFYRRASAGQFAVDNWDSLWSLLVQFTLRKCGRRLQYFRAARRDVRREQSAAVSKEDTSDLEQLAKDPLPSPAEVALLADTVENVMRQLGKERDRKIFELSLQGYSIAEISSAVGHYERGVERTRAKIKAILLALQGEGEGAEEKDE
jgi:RNA polymerase sigma-70 factor (ECF subfamily)